jgi:hypothetical protein
MTLPIASSSNVCSEGNVIHGARRYTLCSFSDFYFLGSGWARKNAHI